MPYADPHAADLQNSVDDLIQQGRLVPGQLSPLLELMGVGQVVVASDSLPVQSGALDPASLAQALGTQPGFQRPAASYGAVRTYVPPPGRSGAAVRLPELARYDTPAAAPGIVRVQPQPTPSCSTATLRVLRSWPPMLVSPLSGRSSMPATSTLDPGRPTRSGAALVFTDSNRRRVVGADLLRANQGPILGAADPIPRDWPSHDLFGSRGSAAQTVAQYSGLRYLRSPVDHSYALLPEHRPFAALDGRLDTSWIATPFSPFAHRYMELGFNRPRSIGAIRVYPTSDSLGTTTTLAVAVNGGPERSFALRPGWNSLRLNSRGVTSLRVRVTGVSPSTDPSGGIAELQVPGLRLRESLRLPQVLASDARGLDLSRNAVSILLQRATADSRTVPARPPERPRQRIRST